MKLMTTLERPPFEDEWLCVSTEVISQFVT